MAAESKPIAAESVPADPRRSGKNRILSSQTTLRHGAYALFLSLSIAACWPTLKLLVHAARYLDFCSQILAAPFISIALVYWKRNEIFQKIRSSAVLGGTIVLLGLILYWFASRGAESSGSYDALVGAACGMVLIWVGWFCAVYGPSALRAALFPLGFLFVTVPIPNYVLDRSVFGLQSGSTAIAHALFQLLGIPVIRQGFVLSLPGLSIEVAKECSSIRSSIALVITCLLVGYLFLRSAWRRTLLVLLALPLSVFKNGVRIVTLSLLSIYVNPAFMKGDLHRDGGFLFYFLALAILFPVFRWFEILDRHGSRKRSPLDRTSVASKAPVPADRASG